MSTSVSTSFTYARDEYVLAMRRYYFSTFQPRRDVIGGVLGIVGGLVVALATDMGWIGWLLVGVSCFLLGIIVYLLLLWPALAYARQPRLRNEYCFSFDNDGIRFKTASVDSTLQWSLYDRWRSDDRFYILYYGKRNFAIIPRRSLTHEDADNQLRQLLIEHIGEPQR